MKTERSILDGPAAPLILELIAEKERCGHELVRELARRKKVLFAGKEGLLYPLLHTLENEKRLDSFLAEDSRGRTRKHYRITKYGLELLERRKRESAPCPGRLAAPANQLNARA